MEPENLTIESALSDFQREGHDFPWQSVNWGQLWLNESFATFMEMSYTQYSRGINAGLRELEQNSQEYLAESRRYRRPMATNFYSNPNVMFDQHTYPKGGVLLMCLRKAMGEPAFYAGLKNYLDHHHGGPVESNDLCESMTEGSGINLHPWFNQWIYKPGHPTIDWSWSYDEVKKDLVVHVKQTQNTADGTPIYDILTHIGVVKGSLERRPMHLSTASQDFHYGVNSKPDAVLFDPDHEFLRELPKQPWTATEFLPVFHFDPNPIDRAYAFNMLLTNNPSDADVQAMKAILEADKGENPAIVDTNRFASLKSPTLRSFWLSELKHDNYDRRATAVRALGMLPSDASQTKLIRNLISNDQPYRVVSAAIKSLATLDFAGNKDVIVKVARSADAGDVRGAALESLTQAKAPEAADLVFAALDEKQPTRIRVAGLRALRTLQGTDARTVPALRSAMKSDDFNLMFEASNIAGIKKLKDLLPDLEALKKKFPFGAAQIDNDIAMIKK